MGEGYYLGDFTELKLKGMFFGSVFKFNLWFFGDGLWTKTKKELILVLDDYFSSSEGDLVSVAQRVQLIIIIPKPLSTWCYTTHAAGSLRDW